MKKDKIYSVMYTCKKCTKNLYFRSNEEYSLVCKTCGMDLEFCNSRPYNPKNNIKQANLMNSRNLRTTQKQTVSKYIPKCPTCCSPDVEKISLSSKVVGGALFGLFSSNVRKTMQCKNCGYKW